MEPAPRPLGELAELANGELVGDPQLPIARVASIDDAEPDSLTFAVDRRWLEKALSCAASAVIAPRAALEGVLEFGKPLIIVDDVRAGLARVLQAFAPPAPCGDFTHAGAVVAEGVVRGAGVWIGAGAVVEPEAVLGDGAVLMAMSYVGRRARVGKRTLLHPHAMLLDECIAGDECILQAGCVIGSDGFGYVRLGYEQMKIPHVGNVVLGDRVEVGACSTIDRALTGSTIVGEGTKIDNLVQVAHNVRIGEHSTLCAQVGVAGSSKLGKFVTVAGQAGIGGHIEIGEQSLILGRAAVSHSLPPHSRVSGYPAQPHRAEMEQKVLLRRLPKLAEQMRALVEAVNELRKRQ